MTKASHKTRHAKMVHAGSRGGANSLFRMTLRRPPLGSQPSFLRKGPGNTSLPLNYVSKRSPFNPRSPY